MIRIFAILLLACSTAYAVDIQPTAKTYEPIVVTHPEGATVQVIPWGGAIPQFLQPPFIKQVSPQVTVFSAPPGAYVVFGGGSMGIVIIDGKPPVPGPGPGPIPDPTPDPDPVPPPQFAHIESVSRQGAAELNDPATATALANALATTIEQSRSLSLEQQVAAVKKAIGDVMESRPHGKQLDWHGKWTVPINAAVRSAAPTSATYLPVIEAVARGLRQSVQSSPQAQQAKPAFSGVSVRFITGPNCVWCDKAKAETIPTLIAEGASVVEVQGGQANALPTFDVSVSGRPAIRHEGFMSIDQFVGIVNLLRR